jgi:DNA-binding CsgD family transcriptional regulator
VTPLHPRLSPRQEEVLLLLGDGRGLGEIASLMGTSTRAVRRLRDRARCELDAATTTQAVAIVVRMRSGQPG